MRNNSSFKGNFKILELILKNIGRYLKQPKQKTNRWNERKTGKK